MRRRSFEDSIASENMISTEISNDYVLPEAQVQEVFRLYEAYRAEIDAQKSLCRQRISKSYTVSGYRCIQQ